VLTVWAAAQIEPSDNKQPAFDDDNKRSDGNNKRIIVLAS